MNAKEVQHSAKVFGKVTEAKQDMDARVLASVGDSGGGLGTPSNPVRYADLFPEIEGISEADANFQPTMAAA